MTLIKNLIVEDQRFTNAINHFITLDLNNGPFIAGGSVRKLWQNLNWQNQDIDVWCMSKEQYELVFKKLWAKKFKRKFETRYATTFEFVSPLNKRTPFKIQIIKKPFDSIEKIFDYFDFTVCQFATDGKTIIASEEAIVDCHKNLINYIPSEKRSKLKLKRIMKYVAYGFYPTKFVANYILGEIKENPINKLFRMDDDDDYFSPIGVL